VIEKLVQKRVQSSPVTNLRGTRTEALAALQRLIVDTGRTCIGESTATVAVLLGHFMATASLAPATRADWQSPNPEPASRTFGCTTYATSSPPRCLPRASTCGPWPTGSGTSTTMDIYWAFVPARDRDAADHLEAILGPDLIAQTTVMVRAAMPGASEWRQRLR
jgi:hypothetical protein